MNTTTSSLPVYNFNTEVNRASVYILPISIALSLITNVMNIAVLSRRSLRSSSCTHYFLALAIVTFIYLVFSPLSIFISNRFGISIFSSPFGCRIQQFFIYSSSLFFISMLVCASVDRYFTSSSSVRLRNFSNVRMAQRIIIVVGIVIAIYMSPFMAINYWDSNTNRCSQYSTTLTVVYLSSRVLLFYIIEPLFMAILGLLTIANIRSQAIRVAPLAVNNPGRRTESQLTRVLFIQITIHLIFSLPAGVTYTITTFIPSMSTPLVTGFRTLSIMWQQAIYFLSFFFYILSATIFRKEFKKIFHFNIQNNRPIRLSHRTQTHVQHMPTMHDTHI